MTTTSRTENEHGFEIAAHPGGNNPTTRSLQHLRDKLIRETETYLSNPLSTAWLRADAQRSGGPAYARPVLSAA